MTAKRAQQLKEKQKREQQKKRIESNKNDLAKELRGTMDIGVYFKTGEKKERFASFKPPAVATIKKPEIAYTAPIATATPTSPIAPGRSPSASPAATGTTAEITAVTGATTLITPPASAR